MKSYKETTDRIFEKSSRLINVRKKRKKAAAGVCAAVFSGALLLTYAGLSSGNPADEPENFPETFSTYRKTDAEFSLEEGYGLLELYESEEISKMVFNELSEPMIRQVQGSTSISLLAKDASEGEIVSALQAVVKGQQYICQEVQEMLQVVSTTEDFIPLTASETEILKLIAHGKSVKEIATLRHSSIHTIVTHKKNLFRKLQVNNVYEATKYAIRAGLVDLIEYYI